MKTENRLCPRARTLTEDVMQSHLRGDTTVGVYPIFDRDKAQFLPWTST